MSSNGIQCTRKVVLDCGAEGPFCPVRKKMRWNKWNRQQSRIYPDWLLRRCFAWNKYLILTQIVSQQ